jgi:hypothetical protein
MKIIAEDILQTSREMATKICFREVVALLKQNAFLHAFDCDVRIRTRLEFRNTGTIPTGLNHLAQGCRASGYPGFGVNKSSTLKGLNGVTTMSYADDATPLGLEIILGNDYPG